MRETCEFRVHEEYAHMLFGPDEGTRLGDSVRKVEISTSDPRFPEVGRLQREIRETTESSFFAGWGYRRRYTKKELADAEIFSFGIASMFEPQGRDCGTLFDESRKCPHCLAGIRQTSDLVLDLRKAPKSYDLSQTIGAEEWIVSQRLAEVLVEAKVTGFELRPVRHKSYFAEDSVDLKRYPSGRELLRRAEEAGVPHPTGPFWSWLNRPDQADLVERSHQEHAEAMALREIWRPKPLRKWYQIIITSPPVSTVPPTRFGNDPFDYDGGGSCPRGHQEGLNVLSELYLSRHDWDGCDIACTREHVGGMRGFVYNIRVGRRPERLLLISQRLYRLLSEHNIKRFGVSVAHLV